MLYFNVKITLLSIIEVFIHMPRANRVFVPGLVWHMTHRCHKKAFLLKFQRDRLRWRYWLFQATQRYSLSVLNYIVTSNHIHLLVLDTDHDTISYMAHIRRRNGRSKLSFVLFKGLSLIISRLRRSDPCY